MEEVRVIDTASGIGTAERGPAVNRTPLASPVTAVVANEEEGEDDEAPAEGDTEVAADAAEEGIS